MSAVMWVRRVFHSVLTREIRPRTRFPRRRQTVPVVEPLEAMALLSTGMVHGAAVDLAHSSAHRLLRHVTQPHVSHVTQPHVSNTDPMSSEQTPVSTPVQTVSLSNTLTNFTNLPLSPTLNLFNPSLGTLLSVTVSHSATIQSNITSQNLSPSSPTDITASLSGSYQIDGLNQPITKPTETITSQPMPAGVFGSGTDTVTFPTILIPDSGTTTFTDPASLAFFTSSAGRSAITLTMNATATSTASAPNGNLLTTTDTSASSTVTVSYTYQTVCPTVSGIGRIGVHHQRTLLVVSFDGPVDVTKAENRANYTVITGSGQRIPIRSATYNPATNSVTLYSSRRLNVHHHFRLSAVIPCANQMTPETVVIPFGSKYSLIGFHNHKGEFVTVKNGRIDGFYNHGQYIPVHNRKIEKIKR
jgi:hypothetical protein